MSIIFTVTSFVLLVRCTLSCGRKQTLDLLLTFAQMILMMLFSSTNLLFTKAWKRHDNGETHDRLEREDHKEVRKSLFM